MMAGNSGAICNGPVYCIEVGAYCKREHRTGPSRLLKPPNNMIPIPRISV